MLLDLAEGFLEFEGELTPLFWGLFALRGQLFGVATGCDYGL